MEKWALSYHLGQSINYCNHYGVQNWTLQNKVEDLHDITTQLVCF